MNDKFAPFFDDNFFIISSENTFDQIKPRVYGYAILEDNIFVNSHNCNFKFPETTYGCYVNVCTNNNTIYLYQDWFGSYGIYLYEHDGYFAVSNSLLYLVNYLKTRKHLTFNHKYAKAFLSNPIASLAFQDTMIEEIVMLPKNSHVEISLSDSTVNVVMYRQDEGTVSIDSAEGIEIIDKWQKKWNSIINTLVKQKRNVSLYLSGGKDSRVCLADIVHPRLDLDEIFFYSAKDKLATHCDDYIIAEQISNIYDFKLNGPSRDKKIVMDPQENLSSSFFIKGGFHRELMCSRCWHEETEYRITGAGGDLRELWGESVEEFIEKRCKWTDYNSVDFSGALKDVLIESVDLIKKNTGLKEGSSNDFFYKNGRQRNHNGKAAAEIFLGNTVEIAPLMDPQLYRLNQNIGKSNDNDLLYAVIYGRFLDELKEVPFDSNRIVIPETLEEAKRINSLYPLNDSIHQATNITIDGQRTTPTYSNLDDGDACYRLLKQLFYSDEVKQFALKVFGEEVYYKADIYYQVKSYHPYIAASGIVQAYIFYNAVEESNKINNLSGLQCFPSVSSQNITKPINYYNNGFMKEVFDFLQSARIDIKNIGEVENNVFIDYSSDPDIYFESPAWWKDNSGSGIVLQSTKGSLKLRLRCQGDGKLLIKCSGPFMKNEFGEILSIKVDFIHFLLKDESTGNVIVLDDNINTVESSNNKRFQIPVQNGQKLTLEIKWYPYIYSSVEIGELVHQLLGKSINSFVFWKQGRLTEMHQDMVKLSKSIRDEAEIHKGNRIILINDDNTKTFVSSLKDINVTFTGKNALIVVHSNYNVKNLTIVAGEGSFIEIGSHFSVRMNLYIDAKAEDTTIKLGNFVNIGSGSITAGDDKGLEVIIGDNFMTSVDLYIRNSDGHTIYDIDSGRIINDTKVGIHIGDNVWCGCDVKILKDSDIPSNCVIGAGSLVCKGEYHENTIIAGVPAKTIRTNVMWDKRPVTDYISSKE